VKKFFKKITNKWLLKGTTTLILVALIIAGYVGINLLVEQLNVEDLDFTTNKLYSLSDSTRERLENLDEDITIQLINMAEDEYVLEYASKYENATDRVTVERIDDISSRVDLQTKYNINTTTPLIVVLNGEKEKTLTEEDLYGIDYTTNSYVDRTEEAMTNAIMEVTIEEKPHIYVLNSKAYRDPEQSLGIIATELIDEANEVTLLDILTKGSIPEDCDTLVITTLKQDLTELERDEILKFINNGGNLLILTSQNTLKVDTPNFNQILAQYGISIDYGIVLEQDNGKMLYDTPNMIVSGANIPFMSKINMDLRVCLMNAGNIKFAESTKLEELGVTYQTLVSTSDTAFVRTDFSQTTNSRTDKDSEEQACILGAHITKKISDENSSQLIIYSDETFASTSQIIIGYQALYAVSLYNNQDVVMNSASYLVEREDTIIIRKTDEAENYTVTDREDAIIKTIIFSIPVIIIIIGIGVWIYRRRKA